MPNPLPPGIEVREARVEDAQSLAALLASAPDDGARYQFPKILIYATELQQLHMDWIPSAIRSPRSLMRLALLPIKGEGEEGQMVVGFSSWLRHEADPDNPGRTRAVLFELEANEPKNGNGNGKAKRNIRERSKALEPDEKRAEAIRRARDRLPPSPVQSIPCFELGGLAVHSDYNGCGIGSLLVRWGLERAAEQGVPVITTGETRGVAFYENALGFQRLRGSEFWLDNQGRDIDEESVRAGSDEWKRNKGGLSGAELIWCPEGYSVEIRGHVYCG